MNMLVELMEIHLAIQKARKRAQCLETEREMMMVSRKDLLLVHH